MTLKNIEEALTTAHRKAPHKTESKQTFQTLLELVACGSKDIRSALGINDVFKHMDVIQSLIKFGAEPDALDPDSICFKGQFSQFASPIADLSIYLTATTNVAHPLFLNTVVQNMVDFCAATPNSYCVLSDLLNKAIFDSLSSNDPRVFKAIHTGMKTLHHAHIEAHLTQCSDDEKRASFRAPEDAVYRDLIKKCIRKKHTAIKELINEKPDFWHPHLMHLLRDQVPNINSESIRDMLSHSPRKASLNTQAIIAFSSEHFEDQVYHYAPDYIAISHQFNQDVPELMDTLFGILNNEHAKPHQVQSAAHTLLTQKSKTAYELLENALPAWHDTIMKEALMLGMA